MYKYFKIILVLLLSFSLFSCTKTQESQPEEKPAEESEVKELKVESVSSLPDGDFQMEATFPDHLDYVDDTLALNSTISFYGYEDQGELFLRINKDLKSFDFYINSEGKHLEDVKKGDVYKVDFSDFAINGRNSLQISSLNGEDTEGCISAYVPYPIVIDGDLTSEGFHEECFDLISDIIQADIDNGFTSAQLAVISHNKLIYSKTWGAKNSYDQDGNPITDKEMSDDETMFDLASVTKMFATNYALQKLISEGKVRPDDKVSDYLGNEFYEDTLDFCYTFGEDVDLETMKKWKASLTLADLLKHEGGFPPAPRYFNIHIDAPSQEYGEDYENILYAGSEHSEETKKETIKAICKTPLVYEPGTQTVYSDVDYMILGSVVEIVSGMSLDKYLKENFFEPLNLDRISFNPLENGYTKDDCAATELNGNTRDHVIYFPGIREYTLQGEVHDEQAWLSMNGVSGHAGLFSNAKDLAKLATLMFNGGYGYDKFFNLNVIDYFTAPKNINDSHYGLGWARQGENKRVWYYGTQSDSATIGHQGWTGTLVMIDPDRDLVMVYLTNSINTPLTNREANANGFRGGWYTAATLGFVPQLFSIGLGEDTDVTDQLISLLHEMCIDSFKLIPEGVDANHPSYNNSRSKMEVYEKWIAKTDKEYLLDEYKETVNRWKEISN